MTFNYFYGTEADQFSFYRIPKALFTDSYFKDLSSDAKILYGLMLDRMSLSIKNQWFDDKNRAYIYFSIEDIMELLNCGRNKAIKSMRELDDETGIGLIEKRRQGFGKVNVIYVKTFMPEKTDEKKFGEESQKFKKQTSVENEESTEVYNSNFMKSKNQTSRGTENKLQEVYISNPNNTNLSDTEMNDNKSNQIVSADENRSDGDNRSEDYQTYAVVRGILGFIFTLLIIATAYCYHDWVQVAFLFSLSVILYLILFAGVFVDTVLDMTRERIIDFIIS